MRIASKFEIEKLADLCSDTLSNDVTVENAFELFEIVTKLHSDSAAIIEFISDNSDALLESDAWIGLKIETLKVLLKQDTLGVEEYPLFKAALRWGEAECKRQKLEKSSLKKVLADVLLCIRFPLFTTSEVASMASSGMMGQDEMVQLFSYSSMTDESSKKKVKLQWDSKPREGASFMKGSKILTSKHKKEFLKFFESGSKNLKFKLLFQASKDGFDGNRFHAVCDGKGATITVIKTNTNIFGGYNSESWNQSLPTPTWELGSMS